MFRISIIVATSWLLFGLGPFAGAQKLQAPPSNLAEHIEFSPSQRVTAALDSIPLAYMGSTLWRDIKYVWVEGDYAYCCATFGLMIVDITNPWSPQLMSRLPMTNYMLGIEVVGDYAYICGGGSFDLHWSTLTIVDVSDVYNPQIVSCFQHPDAAIVEGLCLVDDYAYLATCWPGLTVVDVTDPADPQLVDVEGTHMWYRALDIVGDTAWAITTGTWSLAFDITNRANPIPIMDYFVMDVYGMAVEFAGDLMYLATLYSGLAIYAPLADPPGLLSIFEVDQGVCKDLAVRDSIVYVCGVNGTALNVVNVADPTTPTLITDAGDNNTSTYDMNATGDFLYLANGKYGLSIFDISNPVDPMERGYYNETNTMGLNIEVRGNIGYLATSEWIGTMDLSNPANPTELGRYTRATTHCIDLSSNNLYFGNNSGVGILDVSDPGSLNLVYMHSTDHNYVKGIRVFGDYLYFTMDHAGFGVMDVTDPAIPSVVATYTEPNTTANTVEVINGYAYVGFNRSGATGIWVFDVTDPTEPGLKSELYTNYAEVVHIKASDTLLYVAVDNTSVNDTIWVYSISNPIEPTIVTYIRPVGFGVDMKRGGMDLKGDYLYVANPLPQPFGDWPSVFVMDISDLSSPDSIKVVGKFTNGGSARDIAATSGHVYVATEDGFLVLSQNVGTFCGDMDGSGGTLIDIADLVYLVDYMFTGGPAPPYFELADINADGAIDISDLVYLVDYMFNGGWPPPCDEM